MKFRICVPCCIVHKANAFPDIPGGQLHIGTWLYTLQIAFCPQVPGQGSAHLFRIHALLRGQSVFKTHSGRQPEYGSPRYSGIHVQMPSLHWALDPQGEGLHGFIGSASISVSTFNYKMWKFSPLSLLLKSKNFHESYVVLLGNNYWTDHQYSLANKYTLGRDSWRGIELIYRTIQGKGLYISL